MMKISYERVLKPKFGRGEPDESVIAAREKDLAQFLPVLETGLLDKAWIVGELTVADFTLASTFMLRDGANICLAKNPNIARWIEQVEKKAAWRKAVAEMGLA